MKKHLLVLMVLFLPFSAMAQNTPCSGKKGGVSHCEGVKFVCNDGSYSQSKKACSGGQEENNISITSSPGSAFKTNNPILAAKHVKKMEITRVNRLLKLDYQGFTVWLDCKEHSAVKFQYNAQHDTGNEARTKDFKLDPDVPQECQQTSTAAYGHGYDRGHQVPANLLIIRRQPLNKVIT